MRLESVRFNLDPNGADGSLTLRRSFSESVAVPEWRRGQVRDYSNSPVAYVLSELGQSVPSVLVSLGRDVGDPGEVELRALPVTTPTTRLPPEVLLEPDLLFPPTQWFTSYQQYAAAQAYRTYYYYWQESRKDLDNVLGPIPATTVRFAGNAGTASVLVPLLGSRLAGRGVSVTDISWRWQMRSGRRPWTDIAVTEHRVYTVLAPPTAPWHRQAERANDTQLPWVDALDVACRWASGASTVGDAASAIARAMNGLGPELLEYGCPIAAMSMYTSPFGSDVFDCTAFLERVSGGTGNGRYVNCTDCATVVSTFANLVGSDLWQSRMGSYVPAFLTNPIAAIGSERPSSPCGWGLGFTFHEVAWVGNCTSDDDVFDACLRFPVDTRSPFSALAVPAGMRFGQSGDGQYRDQIAAPTSRGACVPRPLERRRRIPV